MKIEIIYDAKCKHCVNFKSNGRGKTSECLIKSKPLFKGGNTLACDKLNLINLPIKINENENY